MSEAETTAEARRAAQEVLEAQEARRATERALEAHRAAQRGKEALEADRALVATLEAQRAAQSELARAEGNRRNAAEILDGRRELATGRLKPTGKRFTLPPPLFHQLTDEEIAEQAYLDTWCDADGHEFMPYPEPSLRDYEGHAARFEAAHAAWERAEAGRLDRAAREKRATWDERAPELRRRLGTIEAEAARTGIVGRAIEAARSVFDWMRERIEAARGTLGRASPVTRALEADWLDAIADHPRAHGAVRDDHRERTRVLEDQARSVWDEGARLWREVEHRREAARRPEPRPDPRAAVWTPSGPSGP